MTHSTMTLDRLLQLHSGCPRPQPQAHAEVEASEVWTVEEREEAGLPPAPPAYTVQWLVQQLVTLPFTEIMELRRRVDANADRTTQAQVAAVGGGQ